jgi:hypothetical protein
MAAHTAAQSAWPRANADGITYRTLSFGDGRYCIGSDGSVWSFGRWGAWTKKQTNVDPHGCLRTTLVCQGKYSSRTIRSLMREAFPELPTFGTNRSNRDDRSHHPLYQTWWSMIKRCHCKGAGPYQRYGAKGISVCDRWRKSFWDFVADVGPKPSPELSLDRFPSNQGNYEPGNVRWATAVEQQRNKCKPSIPPRTPERLATVGKITMTVKKWSASLKVPRDLVRYRLKRGIPLSGNPSPTRKLTANQVQRLFQLRAGGETSTALGRLFGITDVMVRMIISRECYSDVEVDRKIIQEAQAVKCPAGRVAWKMKQSAQN